MQAFFSSLSIVLSLVAAAQEPAAKGCVPIVIHIGAALSDSSLEAQNARTLATVLQGADMAADDLNELTATLKETGCLALVFESQDFSQVTLRRIHPTPENEKKPIHGGITLAIYRHPDVALPETCKDITQLNRAQRMKDCYGFPGVLTRSSDGIKKAYSIGTTYFSDHQYGSLTDAIRETGMQVANDMIMRRTEYADRVVTTLGQQEALTALNSSILMTRSSSHSWALLEAQGYEADIGSPDLWTKTGKVSAWAQKLSSAGAFLNAQGLAWADHNIGGNRVVNLATFKMPRVITLVGYDPDYALTDAMKKAGFAYDGSKWNKIAAPVLP